MCSSISPRTARAYCGESEVKEWLEPSMETAHTMLGIALFEERHYAEEALRCLD